MINRKTKYYLVTNFNFLIKKYLSHIFDNFGHPSSPKTH